MSFVGLDEKFKPGFPFKFKIKVTYLDGKPVTDGKVEIAVSRSRFYYRGTRQLFQKTYSVKNGIVAGVVEDMPQDTEKLHFKASYTYKSGRIWPKYATSKAWYSPSLSYLQLVKTGLSTAKVDSQGSVKVLYTLRNGTAKHINFHHKIFCKGNLVLSGVTKEDLSDQYYESNLPNTFSTPSTNTVSTPITTQRTYNPTHPFISIPEPTVKEFEIMFNITQAMVPSCRILVYYVRPDKETIGDSIVYDIEDKLENQVSIDFVEKQKRPGEKTKIIMKAKPGSRVAISALDKSVLLLRSSNEIKKSKVLSILNRQDVGPVRYYTGNCLYSWNMPHVADVSEAFNMAGVVFLSNLNVFTQPCGTSQQWFYEENDKPVTTLPPPTYIWGLGGDGDDHTTEPPTDADLITLAATHAVMSIQAPTDAAMTTQAPTDALVMTATSKTVIPTRLPVRKKKPIKKVKVRKDFPETWLWTEVKLK
ncbi:Hypothetical predicted protein [Paramuricea clavata]|nr:Hypothetical predicted protein [Paramuricea clavata]